MARRGRAVNITYLGYRFDSQIAQMIQVTGGVFRIAYAIAVNCTLHHAPDRYPVKSLEYQGKEQLVGSCRSKV